ncbi:hypothetical protein MRB53_026361 [Persea americana]|uniref:Uncharacterized protein n=1 Tax=Persea americana TaxID=3435 RepID=A0ACC2LI43_PERAE|nr:hypothetical protein MRB53_026361 [Persea americana]
MQEVCGCMGGKRRHGHSGRSSQWKAMSWRIVPQLVSSSDRQVDLFLQFGAGSIALMTREQGTDILYEQSMKIGRKMHEYREAIQSLKTLEEFNLQACINETNGSGIATGSSSSEWPVEEVLKIAFSTRPGKKEHADNTDLYLVLRRHWISTTIMDYWLSVNAERVQGVCIFPSTLAKEYVCMEFASRGWAAVGWEMHNVVSCPQQGNSDDCGVFVMAIANHLARRHELRFTQADMWYFRQKIVHDKYQH